MTEKLQKKLSQLNEENRALKEELKISKQPLIIFNSDIAVSPGRLELTVENNIVELADESEIKINSDENSLVEIPGVEDNYSIVNINTRFDMQGFLSDLRFRELHASLGVKLQNYVDKKLKGIELMQYNPEGAKMLIEIDD